MLTGEHKDLVSSARIELLPPRQFQEPVEMEDVGLGIGLGQRNTARKIPGL